MVQRINGVAVGAIIAGSTFVYGGIKGYSVMQIVQYSISGKSPATADLAFPVTPDMGVTRAEPMPTGGDGGGAAPMGTPGSNVALARMMAAQYGWTGEQWNALYNIWTRESGFRTNADNPSSSAYGIPQALPGSKMATAGADWRTNPATQIKWGLGYIRDRYGDPVRAWAFWQAHSWY